MSKPPTHPRNDLASLFTRRREELGLSRREAARRIGIAPSYLFALEQGRNPSTGRAPVPSAPILAAIGRVLDIDPATLLDVSVARISPSSHLLLYQTGAGHRSPLDPARALFADRVDAWIELVDPRAADGGGSSREDVLVSRREPLVAATAPRFEAARALAALSEVLAEAPRSRRRLGIVFGAGSAVLRCVENPPALLESETTWEHDVGAVVEAALGAEVAATVCVYRESDIQEVAPRLDPLATVLSLVQAHPYVAVDDGRLGVATGAAAIERVLAGARPAGAGSETWASLARAAAVGLAREAAASHPGGGRGRE